jgi:hypothetical protein
MNTHMTTGSEVSDIDAGAMHKDYLRDRRIERILSGQPLSVRKVRGSKRNGVQTQVASGSTALANLEAETGWTPEAAAEMAAECRRDHRLFGRTELYS